MNPPPYRLDAFSAHCLGLSRLPTTPPSLGSFATKTFHLTFLNSSQVVIGDAVGTINSLSMTPVPLPPAVILFGAGLVALVGLGARNWQQKRSGLA